MNKRKDILFLCQFFYPEFVSSAQMPFETAESFIKAGSKVDVICGYPREYVNKKRIPLVEIYQGIRIIRVKYLQLNRKALWGRIINYFSFVMVILARIFMLRNYQYIIVYSNPPILPIIAIIAKKIWKAKVVYVSYDVYPEIAIQTGTIIKDGAVSKIFEKINYFIFKNADKIVAISGDMKEFLCKNRSVSCEKVEVIPNWYKDKGIIGIKEKVNNKLFLDIPTEAFVISYLGNMGTCQEMKTYFESIRKMKKEEHVHFVFAGHGNKLEKIKEIVKIEKLTNVHIYNFLQDKDYEDILKISNAFMVTLQEGLWGLCSPSKVCSYLMAGRPILAVMDIDMELAKDIKKMSCGFAVKNGESDELVHRIRQLINDTELCREMGKNSRKLYLDKYEKDICINQYLIMLNNM